jgi:hypothetical protein
VALCEVTAYLVDGGGGSSCPHGSGFTAWGLNLSPISTVADVAEGKRIMEHYNNDALAVLDYACGPAHEGGPTVGVKNVLVHVISGMAESAESPACSGDGG